MIQGKTGRLLSLVCSSLSLAALLAGTSVDRPFPEVVETITSADLQSALYFLASDEMQGREINTPFNEIAGLYLAHRFQSMGLEPAADQNSYFHYFSLVSAKLGEPNHMEITRQDSSLVTTGILKEDYFPSNLSAAGRVTASVVFAGYGITAPQHNYDDYQNLNVRKKIVVILNHEPGEKDPDSPFDGLLDSDYGEQRYKILNAQRHEAVGVIIVPDSDNHPEERNFSHQAQSVWPEDSSREHYALKIWTDQIKIPVLIASTKLVPILLNEPEINLKRIQKQIDQEYQPHSFEVGGVKVAMETSMSREQTRVRNVLAYLPGSDPRLKEELVIVSAHFDHIGTREGKIFNGADDDASGTVGLLEVAEAYALNSAQPRRSLLFAAWNAEERGLLGSRYYVEKPLFPLAKTVAVFQMDMIGRNEEISDPGNPRFQGLEKQRAEQNSNSVNILGYTRSDDLRALVTENNRHIALDLKFRYDNNPANLLRRSDNWPFLSGGVPALFFHTGLHPDYHQPTDTADRINYPKLEKVVRLVFLSSWAAANVANAPRLNHESRRLK